MATVTLINEATTTTTSIAQSFDDSVNAAFQAYGQTSTGSGSATINIQCANDTVNWITIGTITLTLGTAATSDAIIMQAPWSYVRAVVSAISGTDASVTVTMGN